MPKFTGNPAILKVLQYALMVIPFIVYIAFVAYYAQNIPRQDDYDAILGFLCDYNLADMKGKLAMLFLQHNEHRILFSRLLYVAYYTVAGSINFKGLIYINAIVMTLIVAICSYFARQLLPQQWRWAVVAISCCLFSINSYENADFAMAGSQNFGVIFLFLASMYLYSKKKRNLLPLAALLQVLCVFSSGNGNVAAFFLLVYNLLNKDRAAIITSVACFLIFSPLYYYHYHSPGGNPMMTHNPLKFLPFFLHAIGAHALYKVSLLAGFGIVMGFGYLFPWAGRLKVKKNTLPFICLALFVFCSMGVMSIFRGNQAMDHAYASRYFVYSNLITAVLSVFLFLKFSGHAKEQLIYTGMAVFLLFCYYRNVKEGKAGFRYIYNNLHDFKYDYPDQARAQGILDESCRQQIYCK